MGKNNKKNKRKRSLSADTNKPEAPSAATTTRTTPKKSKANDAKPSDIKSKQLTTVNNPLFDKQSSFLHQESITDVERNEFFSDKVSTERRAQLWMDQADLGEELVNRYAWATPDETAIRILKEFSPLVEIGCGSNAYWCKILKDSGVDIIGYDVNVDSGGMIEGKSSKNKKKQSKSGSSYIIKQGGPEVLESEDLRKSGRKLFLCYPDEEVDEEDDDDDDEDGDVEEEEEETMPSSMGWKCLNHYSGDYVIHVGETFMDANLSVDQAPWGRSSSAEFQQRLSCEFHCLLKVELPNWFHTRDTISVWKRSPISTLVFAAEDEDDEDEEVEYRHIPPEERLPTNVAAPCLAHLLPSHPINGKISTSPKAREDATAETKNVSHLSTKNKLDASCAAPDKADSRNAKSGQSKSSGKKKKKKPATQVESAKQELLRNLEKELKDDDSW